MNLHEWPLTLFTVLAQMSVGAFITLGIIQLAGRRKFSSAVVDRVADPALYAIGPIMICSFVASMFHLGNPLHAPNVLRGVGHSPLSQEIVMGMGFAALGFAFAACQYFGWLSPKLRSFLAILTAAWGVVFVYVMASLYMIITVPAWNNWTTPVSFYLTSLITGSLAIAVALTSYHWLGDKAWLNKLMPRNELHSAEEERDTALLIPQALQWIGVIVMVAVPLQLVVLLVSALRNDGPAAHFEFSPVAWVIRLVFLLVGAGLMVAYLLNQSSILRPVSDAANHAAYKRVLITVTSSYVLITISAILGRFIFYGGFNHVGL
ncbi:dimethyl sulfoxide reductase anchor subunit family protein [Corynebacterium caspium]|uniref:dimethyl sulfoxide reductase anchor subunit family protein n=1 Tax=Corynebacterium caspium TaxID=234828 RepID=UPI0003820009|nr:DmsC/YnfH family molybdoenzyme membrane anchor subunit [Corynebacterium caspium]WKD58812.1 Anaerobic dimethyl sulfoxide reductase chain C [Corynebacterium caspium DSM 44850]